MGLRDMFKSRKERESAIPGGSRPGDAEGVTPLSGSSAGGAQMSTSGFAGIDATGLAGMSMIGPALGQALHGNQAQAMTSSQIVDLQNQGNELRNSILETLKAHGIDAEKGQAVSITDPTVAQDIFKTLSEHGLDASHMGVSPAAFGAIASAAPGATPSLAGGDSIGQLERLGKLHEQGVLTDAEFAEQKQKILGT